jgi:RNA polymerase sigma-70 factor (ECF subfamily)
VELREPEAGLVAPAEPPPAVAAGVDIGALLAAARAGDGDAFAALYRRFAPVVHGVALARIGPSDADDVVQETFFALHRAIGTLRDAAALSGWLRSVAANAAIDRLRRRARRPAREPLPDCEARPLGKDDGELRRDVLHRIQELPEAYRETLVLRLVEGLSGPEIAEFTGMTSGSVRINLCRGMAMLRERLERDGWRGRTA